MKIPKKLKIGGHIFKVKICDYKDDYGDLDMNTSTITINKKLLTLTYPASPKPATEGIFMLTPITISRMLTFARRSACHDSPFLS